MIIIDMTHSNCKRIVYISTDVFQNIVFLNNFFSKEKCHDPKEKDITYFNSSAFIKGLWCPCIKMNG